LQNITIHTIFKKQSRKVIYIFRELLKKKRSKGWCEWCTT